jgi:plastocyanin
VTGSAVTPAPAQVDLPVGQTLTLVVTSDHDDQLHAHGFEVEEDIKAGVPATIALTGKDPGVYEVELHHPALTLLTVAVR